MRQHWKYIACFAVGIAMLAALLVASALDGGQVFPAQEGVSFSVESGFYDEPFYLEMTAGDGDIYYTLDSTEPDENALRYTAPLLIQDASANDNVYSMITDVVLDLNPSLLTDNGAKPSYAYEVPGFPVDKATVVRAVCIDALGNRSKVESAVYFIGFGEKSGYSGMKIMSVTTDPKNLFDSETGIYVIGDKFSEAQESGELLSKQGGYSFWPANYRQRGKDWEREAHVCCFDEHGEMIANGSYGIRVQGGASRARLPKGLNIIGRKKYGSPSFDGEKLFDIPAQLTTVNLSNGGNDGNTLMKDYIVNVLAADMNVAARPYEPCALFLDGEYWGVYWLTPRLKEDYLSQRYGVTPSNIVEVKANAIEIGEKSDLHFYEDMRAYIADNDMSLGENYDRACELIDIDSCVDYYALEIYIANSDWPKINRALWRTRVRAGGSYSDCRWRWLLYDVNLAMRASLSDTDMVQWAINRDPMFASLMENADFSKAISDKLAELASVTFEPAQVKAFVESYKVDMAEAVEKRYKRFYGENKSMDSFYKECDAITDFFEKRSAYIINQYGGKDNELS